MYAESWRLIKESNCCRARYRLQGLPFGPMPDMMCEAEYVDKLRAICLECGDPASYSQRTSKDSDQVVIGEMDKYEARCRNCFQPPEGH